ncbi:Rieske 2Fe-2S domain-containing protein [Streptomyces noursei]|uniref:Rieske 2Fe-2S domain-containing protein n=1 Tax=Streptomyces noursei TaxID=1971 RepID=UPI0023B81985|nr:Rieske 2Fe-2S domain-containing protein [Streptomyces noursei]
MTPHATAVDARVPAGLNLPASWYVAFPSGQLARRPRALKLFGEPLVAWRDGAGRPVLMPRHCPHMGASLADGKIVEGGLQCPFHHWRFDRSGACVAVPGTVRIPSKARLRPYPTVERYGYVWAWYGSEEPMFPLPEMPSLDEDQPGHRRFRLADSTGATVRRILENTYDPDHLVALHGLEVAGPCRLRMLTDQQQTQDHGPPIDPQAWLGAELTWPGYTGKLGAVTRLLGTNAEEFVLRVDGWPAGQRISYWADGVPQYQLLLATTPIAPNRTIQHITAAVLTTGRRWRDLRHYLANRLEITFASHQDLPVFNTMEPGDRHGIYLERDRGVLRFRKHYQQWVDRVADHA